MPPLSLSPTLLFSLLMCSELWKQEHPSYCQVNLLKTSGWPQERATVQNKVLGMACVLCMCVLPSTQILMARCLVLSVVSVCVLMWDSWNLRVGWHSGMSVCVCVLVSLFVFRDRLTVLSQNRWMNCKLEECGVAILLSNLSSNPQHRIFSAQHKPWCIYLSN